ncbi:MAG: hypothetical protein AAFU64_16890 [Bacteroidota bacterium]
MGHYGGDRGFRSFLMMMPEADLGIVLLSNADFAEEVRSEVVFTLADWLLNIR